MASPEETDRYYIGVGCTGCGQCKRVCPQDCIEGTRGFAHVIRQADCVQCGSCAEACPSDCIRLDD